MKLSQLYTKKVDGTIENFNPIVSEADVLPAQSSSTNGKFLQSNGVSSQWITVDALPDQSASTNDKFLKSTGAAGAEVWTDVTVPTKVSDLTNDTGFITASDNITGSSASCTGNSATATTASKVANSLTLKDPTGTSQTFDGSTSLDLSDGVYYSTNASNYSAGGTIESALSGKASLDVATTSANGLMSSTDKTKLDGIGSGANVISVNGQTGAVTLAIPSTPNTYVTETYSSGRNWYRKWSNGWIEQGGYFSSGGSSGGSTFSFVTAFSTTNIMLVGSNHGTRADNSYAGQIALQVATVSTFYESSCQAGTYAFAWYACGY